MASDQNRVNTVRQQRNSDMTPPRTPQPTGKVRPHTTGSLEKLRRGIESLRLRGGRKLTMDEAIAQLLTLNDLLCEADETGLSPEHVVRQIQQRSAPTPPATSP